MEAGDSGADHNILHQMSYSQPYQEVIGKLVEFLTTPLIEAGYDHSVVDDLRDLLRRTTYKRMNNSIDYSWTFQIYPECFISEGYLEALSSYVGTPLDRWPGLLGVDHLTHIRVIVHRNHIMAEYDDGYGKMKYPVVIWWEEGQVCITVKSYCICLITYSFWEKT